MNYLPLSNLLIYFVLPVDCLFQMGQNEVAKIDIDITSLLYTVLKLQAVIQFII